MTDYEMDSWDEEEEEKEKELHKQHKQRSYRKEQQLQASRDLRKYRNNYPDRRKERPYQEEKSLHKNQYKGAMWFLMCFLNVTPRLVIRLIKFLLTSLASCYRRLRQKSTQSKGGEALPEMQNLDFYLNKKLFKPNGECIEVILDQWKNDYELLEHNHSYIQWLFPLQEQGMNYRAKMLTKIEIEMMKNDKEVQRRFLEAYKLMLGFYGIKLVNKATGEVERAEKFEERFDNLNYHGHNNLRITRILKSLGELGFEHYQAPLVKFFLVETLVEKRLPNVKNSVLDYFMFTVKDKEQRRDLMHFAWEKYEPRYKFIWGPIEKLSEYKKPSDCDSEVGGETGGKENMAKSEAEKRCGEHGDGQLQVGDDDDDSNKTSSHVEVTHDMESQAKHRTLDPNVGGSRGRQDKGQGPRKEEEGEERKGSSNKDEDAVLGTSGCGTDNNTQIEGSSVDEDHKVVEHIEHKAESPRRLEEDNETKVTILEMENKGEPSASEKETESHDGSGLTAGSAECRNKEKGSTHPVEETKKSSDDKSESSGGSDNDNKKTGLKMDGRKRSSNGNRKGGLPQLDSTNADELSCELTKNCAIIPLLSVTTGKTDDDDDDVKKVKLDSNSSGDSETSETSPDRDPDESEVLLVNNDPPHQMNVEQNPQQDTAGGNCNTRDQMNSYL